jgi:hypothetical protein
VKKLKVGPPSIRRSVAGQSVKQQTQLATPGCRDGMPRQFNRKENIVNASRMQRQPRSNADLSQVVAPLASYICATDRPREALYSALAALFDEMKKTNTAARLHVASLRADSLGLSW